LLNLSNSLVSCCGGTRIHFFLPRMLVDQLYDEKTSAWNGVLRAEK
jgi:hypothetical protein